MFAKIFTLTEFCVWYQLDRRTVRRMLRTGQLPGIRTPAGWRIPDPGAPLFDRLRQQQLPLQDIPCIRGVEAAELLGVSDRRVRRMAQIGILPYAIQNKRRVYSLADIIALVNRRTEGKKRQPGSYVRPWMVDWAQKRLAYVARYRRRERSSPFPDVCEASTAGEDNRISQQDNHFDNKAV